MTDAIRIEGLTKRYGALTAVDRLSLTVRTGELLALLGVNGAGKTTTVRMLCGLCRPSEGDAYLEGRSLRHEAKAIRSLLSTSPQETAIAPMLTARENLALIGGAHGFTKQRIGQRVEELSAQLSLSSVLDRPAGKLSGGFQRRLSIAMALISEPRILFLDEPTLGLDVLARSELWGAIRALKGRVTVVLTTHYMEEAEELADRVAIMAAGRLLVCDTPSAILKQTGATRFDEAFVRVVGGARV